LKIGRVALNDASNLSNLFMVPKPIREISITILTSRNSYVLDLEIQAFRPFTIIKSNEVQQVWFKK